MKKKFIENSKGSCQEMLITYVDSWAKDDETKIQ